MDNPGRRRRVSHRPSCGGSSICRGRRSLPAGQFLHSSPGMFSDVCVGGCP
ncbi:Hypothetical protein CAP_6435 [Chondromyces apiculatus DSM 436]|uniref:Uncharacterized protein n=1 Tax=Chondromyces apiculatus DSM 436 TaxID=1192034 RepID=A0A017T1X6_9BACT|nr:Hypothetical protein CAP_6435 [Chondromyces apiculatus DSM 436]